MKALKLLGAIGTTVGFLGFSAHAYAAQWETNITVTQAIVGNYSGEYLQLLISNTVLNLRSCPSGETYVLRDPAIIQSAIAIALTAVASGRQIRVYVTDSCDAPTARPLVSAIGLT